MFTITDSLTLSQAGAGGDASRDFDCLGTIYAGGVENPDVSRVVGVLADSVSPLTTDKWSSVPVGSP